MEKEIKNFILLKIKFEDQKNIEKIFWSYLDLNFYKKTDGIIKKGYFKLPIYNWRINPEILLNNSGPFLENSFIYLRISSKDTIKNKICNKNYYYFDERHIKK